MIEKLNCIMIIDDDEPTNFISTMVLEEVSCAEQLLVFESAEKALQQIKRDLLSGNGCQVPQLIFLDINMPRMNGWEFLEAFTRLAPLQKPVIVMLTTSQNPEDKFRAEQVSAIAAFETKPITAEMVKNILETHFHPALNRITLEPKLQPPAEMHPNPIPKPVI